jgi:hypothetical protein
MTELWCGTVQNFIFGQMPQKKKTRQVHKNLMSFQTDILTFPLKKAYNLLIAVM